MGFGIVKSALGQVQDQVFDRGGEIIQTEAPDAGAFLQDWIGSRLPSAVIGFASKVAGREDGSGWFTNEAMKAGKDPNVGSLLNSFKW